MRKRKNEERMKIERKGETERTDLTDIEKTDQKDIKTGLSQLELFLVF